MTPTDSGVRVVLCTAPAEGDAAERIASALVAERLAACVNRIPGLRSFYTWQGEVCDDPEVLLVVKTTRDSLERLQARIAELHPYDVPEVIALPVVGGARAYVDWVLGGGG